MGVILDKLGAKEFGIWWSDLFKTLENCST